MDKFQKHNIYTNLPSSQTFRTYLEEMVVARHRLGKHVPASKNTHATIEKLLDEVFPIRSVSYQGK
jgi:hypothetical protein